MRTLPGLTRLLFGLLLLATNLQAAEAPIPDKIVFNRDIRPILSDTCFHCHGPDKNARKAGLRFDLREEALKKTESGENPIVPGKPEASEFITRIFADDPAARMPPPEANKPLTARQKELFKRWIAQGAVYQPHWAFLPIQRPPVPSAGKVANPIDAFIRERLAANNLQPAAEADRATLIRRVTLDLTGLPPTPAEIDAFLNDTAPQAYERVVDRLLKSPHFGERMAIDWLDAARYADTNGYQVDRDRSTYAWRDWVIRAFNENKRFDQFTIEQIAGDLLPHATFNQRIATGFHRNHMMNEEGGIIPEEFLAEYTADRVESTATIWLGQTFNCTRCHDHKFDPFTQRDFYSLKAFFHNVTEEGVGDYSKPSHLSNPPLVKLPAPELEQKISGLQKSIAALENQRRRFIEASSSHFESWALDIATHTVSWSSAPLLDIRANFTDTKHLPKRSAVRFPQLPPQSHEATLTVQSSPFQQRITAIRVTCIPEKSDQGRMKWSGLKVRLAPKQKQDPAGPYLTLKPVNIASALSPDETRKLLDGELTTRIDAPLVEKQQICAVFALAQPLQIPDQSPITLEVQLKIGTVGAATNWQVELTNEAFDRLLPESIVNLARKGPARWTKKDIDTLAEARAVRQPEFIQAAEELARLKRSIIDTETAIPTALVMQELPKPRDTFILMRGEYDKFGAKVSPSTPATLPPMHSDWPRNRLGLARWLVDPANPLPARVTVNRYWQLLFGTGLVRTAEDFGSQGEPPSHPELLDWLASEFVSSGWDVKATLRLIVTSQTYRQRSKHSPALRERDPENRLLARGPRFRLSAEMIRDQALSASGLLVTKIGGPSVKPYHPPGMYEQVTAGTGTNVYVVGKGDDLHRRSMYTYWKRSVPHPAMMLFDAPFRETCTLRRPRTNTPLQALNLLNDTTFVEAARFLGQRMLLEGGSTTESRLTHGYRILLGRAPRSAELTVLKSSWDRAVRDFESDPKSASEFLKVGDSKPNSKLPPTDLAAAATIAATLLNLDETVTKE